MTRPAPLMTLEGHTYVCQAHRCGFKSCDMRASLAHAERQHKAIYCIDRDGNIYDARTPQMLREVGVI